MPGTILQCTIVPVDNLWITLMLMRVHSHLTGGRVLAGCEVFVGASVAYKKDKIDLKRIRDRVKTKMK